MKAEGANSNLTEANLGKGVDLSSPHFPISKSFWQDASFEIAAEGHRELKELASNLPPDLDTEVFTGQRNIEELWSSYKDHGYGYFFYALTRVLRPKLCVEIGVLQGFSLLTVASALRDNAYGTIQGFDLFEDYPYRHENYTKVLERIETFGLESWATATRANAFQVHEEFNAVDYLHVDISNNGNVYRQVFEQWSGKVRKVILLEGGSSSRDQVEWMLKYDKPPIASALEEIRVQYPNWDIFVLDSYPSLTVAMRADRVA